LGIANCTAHFLIIIQKIQRADFSERRTFRNSSACAGSIVGAPRLFTLHTAVLGSLF
jgi:hypothetical protein